MSNLAEQRVLPQAVARRSRRFSIIWIVPLVAVAIGAWLAWDTLSKEGPTIEISFESGEGLQAGQSQLKFKDIVFGTVKSLELAPDDMGVIGGELEALDRAKDDVLELELRLAGLQPLAVVEGNCDLRPLFRPRVPGEPSADRNRDQRD